MELSVFTVYDSKTEAYLPPFYMAAKGAAIRSFSDTCNDPSHAFNKHPSDYTLFELGIFDDQTSRFTLLETAHPLGIAQEFINIEE